jgi:hypothetical protein
MSMRKPRADGIGGDATNIPPVAASVRAVVFTVSVVEAGLPPSITLAGEKDAVQSLGSPVQPKDTAESTEPNWRVTRTV